MCNYTEKPPNVAVVSFDSLGDGLLYIMFAHNLVQHGMQVTYYGTVGYQLAAWLPHLDVQPYPDWDNLTQSLKHHDLVWMSPPSHIRVQMAYDERYLETLKNRYALICQKIPASWGIQNSKNLLSKLAPQYASLVNGRGSIRYQEFYGMSAVDMLCSFMQNRMGLNRVTKDVPIKVPANLKHCQHKKRIIISPDSAGPASKEWGVKQFLNLCHQLKVTGYDPKIVVSPKHHDKWKSLAEGRFDVPKFPNLGDLAAYLYESGALIANDSGNGHLASFLNVPVVTIYKKRNPKFSWRPDWRPSKVVCPFLVIKLKEFRIWRPFVTVTMVVKALEQVID